LRPIASRTLTLTVATEGTTVVSPKSSRIKEMPIKRAWMLCVVGVLLLGSAARSQDKKAGGGTEKAVAALEEQWLQSQKTNNPDVVAPLLADKFINTASNGKVTEQGRVACKREGH